MRSGADAAAAGITVVAAMTIFAVSGYGLGSPLGIAVPAGLAGLFAGVVVGCLLVYARFKDL